MIDIDFRNVRSQDEAVNYLRDTLPQVYTQFAQIARDITQQHCLTLNIDENFVGKIISAADEFESCKANAIRSSYDILEYGGPDWSRACQLEYNRFHEAKTVLVSAASLANQSLQDLTNSINRTIFEIENEIIRPLMSTQ